MRFWPTRSAPPSPARFKAGVICLVLNYILGWPCLLAIESAAAIFKSPTLAVTGPIVYGFSWGLLGIGLWLAGPEALTYVKQRITGLWKKPGDSPS